MVCRDGDRFSLLVMSAMINMHEDGAKAIQLWDQLSSAMELIMIDLDMTRRAKHASKQSNCKSKLEKCPAANC